MRVLAVDPGKATGIATFCTDSLQASFHEETFEGGMRYIWWWCGHQQEPAVVVPEMFLISGGTVRKSRGKENWSIETIGVCRFACLYHGHELDLKQTAGAAKGFGSDALLRDLGWWTPGSDHARDAARHLALWLGRREKDVLDELLRRAGR